MSKFSLLTQQEEDDLHAKRLLNIEQKHYQRIQKRLLTLNNPIQSYIRRVAVDAPPPPPKPAATTKKDDEEFEEEVPPTAPETDDEVALYLKSLESFSYSCLHDFSSLTTSLARLQFLLSANKKERERYAQQSENITIQHSNIRDETARLRTRLSEARTQLEVRKGWDKHAEKVLWVDGKVGTTKSKTREELGRESDKLRQEIEELEREGEELKGQWRERRNVLQDVKGEALRLRRVIRGQPEEVVEEHKDEERSQMGDGDEEQKRREGSHHPEGGQSNVGTPRPFDDGASTPLPVSQAAGSGGMTPRSIVEPGAGDEVGVADAAAGTPQPDVSVDADMADVSEQKVHTTIPEVKVDEAEKAEIDGGETGDSMDTI